MHADALSPQAARDGDWGRPVLLALLVHILVLLVFTAAWLWSPERSAELAAGDPSLEASLDVSAADARVARQALKAEAEAFTPPLPTPVPVPLPEPAPEDTLPPPQPLPEPRPQDAPTPQQSNAQERVAQPDTIDQEQVSALAESEEKAKREQEAKRRQEQIDLTERKRQEQAEQQRRLAKQQEEADKKKLAEQQAQSERDRKLAELRKKREQVEAQMARDAKQADLARQKLRQLEAARAQTQAGTTAASGAATAGAGGTSSDLSAKYVAAIQQAVLNQWVRPDSVPLGQKCSIHIRQVPGGSVIEAQVSPNCPFDEAGRRSIEAAVLRAQPLPYRGFESVFARDLNFNFTAQDH